jgi:AAA+ ATPase superfamily predicted ATPase
MNQFINRERELAALEKFYASGSPGMIVVWGRRRVGKTSLLIEFAKEKQHFYYLSKKLPLESQPRDFAARFASELGDYPPDIDKWDKAVDYVLSRIDGRALLIVDEFPYLIEADDSVPSIWQSLWDQDLSKRNVMLVLMGSSVSMMERDVLGPKSPLYGRRSGQIKLEQLGFREAREFFPEWGLDDCLRAYAILGGVPAYLKRFTPAMGLWENIASKILEPTEMLYEEPPILLREELRTPEVYIRILESVASGARTMSDIADRSYLPYHNAPKYLRVLCNLGFLEKISPIGVRKERKAIYRMKDNYTNFWSRFVYPHRGEIEFGRAEAVLATVRKELDEWIGRNVFERAAMEYLARYVRVPFALGPWWSKTDEVDVAGVSKSGTLLAECKWSSSPVGPNVLASLAAKSSLVGPAPYTYYVFSRAGFTPAAKRLAAETGAHLVDLKGMYARNLIVS